jgi:chaperonin GroEL
LKNVAAGQTHFNQTRNGKGYTIFVTQINEFAQPVEDIQSIQQVATISSGNDEIIGSLIADALSKVGKEGVISLEEGKGIVTELEITEGMKLEKVLSHLISLRIQNGSFIRQSIHSSNG